MSPLLVLASFVAVTTSNYLLNIRRDQIDTRVSLSRCIIEATKTYFSSDFETITFSLPIVEQEQSSTSFVMNHFVLGELQRSNQWLFIIKNGRHPARDFKAYPTITKNYIIQIRQRGEFAGNLKRLKASLTWNPHAKFLIVSPTVFDKPDSVAIEITEVLWKYHVLDAAILLVEPTNTSTFLVYSWEPYSDKGCGGDYSNIFLIDRCSFGVVEENSSWFNDKITFSGFNNCSLKASFIVWPPFVTTESPIFRKSDFEATQGIEVNLINMIAENLNLFVEYTSGGTAWGAVFLNGTVTGDFKLLAEDAIDIVLGGYTNTFGCSLLFDCSNSYIQEVLVWCTPHEPVLLGLLPMIKILSKEVWIGLSLLYFIATYFAWTLAKQSNKEISSYKQLENVAIRNFLILIGLTADVLPRSKGARFFTGVLMLFSLHLNMLYTSYLTSTLSSPIFKEKYKNLESIYEFGLNTYFVPEYKNFFNQISSDSGHIEGVPLSEVMDNWRNCGNVTECVEEIIEGKPNALCLPLLYKEYLLVHIADFHKNKYKINCLKEKVANFPVNLIMRKGFPLYAVFQKTIDRINNAGFISKWEKDLLYEKRQSIQYEKEIRKETSTIRFVNLRVIFDCLFFAEIFCFLVFIGELVVFKRREKQRN
ncbi:unnamed protein product [Phyllotreta striolata]|uniref:Uncharacterized protein n=1 Tax=Phyllotreta striolata TaxID=444603 RepID=A0A9N9XKU5_PHYSR|nr:unnamed protein product [Phyllotreta striolata]